MGTRKAGGRRSPLWWIIILSMALLTVVTTVSAEDGAEDGNPGPAPGMPLRRGGVKPNLKPLRLTPAAPATAQPMSAAPADAAAQDASHPEPATPPPPPDPTEALSPAGAPSKPASAADRAAGAKSGGQSLISREPPEDLGKPLNPKAKIYFDFEDASLDDLLKEISEKLRINFIVGDKIKSSKITIRCPNPITVHEAWLAFLSALELRGLTVVKVGKFYKVIQFKDAMKSPSPIYSDADNLPKEERAITYVYHLKHLAIKDVEPILKQLKSGAGEVVAFLPTNSFIITDSGLNVNRMLKMLEQIDVPGQQDHIHIVEIYYADATGLSSQINELFGDKAQSAEKARPPVRQGRPKGAGGAAASEQNQDGNQEKDAATVPMITKVIPDERTNQLIIICPDSTLPMVMGLIRELDVPIPGEGQVHIYYLENANAEDVSTTLASLAQNAGKAAQKGGAKGQTTATLFEGEVKITADKATNSLVIVASLKDFNRLKRVIQQLDVRRRQVFVEAVIMEVTLRKNRSLGVAFNGGVTVNVGGETVPIFGGTYLGSLNSIVLDPTALQGMAVGLRGPDLEGTEGLIIPGVSLPSFGVILQALQTDANANVLSTPHILTMDNEEAQIVVGSNVPFITGQSRDYNNNAIVSIQRQDVALTMKIKPQINESDFIKLQIEHEITEVISVSDTLGPTTTKRAAKTVVVVKDGQTVVIGGLMKDSKSEDITKVPFLGDIPVIGRLFRTSTTITDKSNLLIFLTPYIIRDETDFQRIFKRKMRERAEFLRRFYSKEEEYEPPVDWDRKVGPFESINITVTQEGQEAESQASGQTYYLQEGRKVRTLSGDATPDAAENSGKSATPSETIQQPPPRDVEAKPLQETPPPTTDE